MKKNSNNKLLSLVLGTLLLTAAGCSSRQVEFYQLPYAPASIDNQAQGLSVLIGPIKLADYLQREQILQRQLDGRLLYSRQGRWAGGLDEEVGQLLLSRIAASSNNSQISLYPDRVGVGPAAQILVSINRLDSGEQLPAVLQAQWRLLDVQGKQHSSRILSLEQEHDGSMAGQVQAQSDLLQQLADELSQALDSYSRPLLRKKASTESRPAAPESGSAGQSGKAVYRF